MSSAHKGNKLRRRTFQMWKVDLTSDSFQTYFQMTCLYFPCVCELYFRYQDGHHLVHIYSLIFYCLLVRVGHKSHSIPVHSWYLLGLFPDFSQQTLATTPQEKDALLLFKFQVVRKVTLPSLLCFTPLLHVDGLCEMVVKWCTPFHHHFTQSVDIEL